jgi:predicted esterase
MKILKAHLNYQNQITNALVFLPDGDGDTEEERITKPLATFAILTHGYTSDKSSLLNWAIRLAESQVSVILFDLPGHYLGNFSEVEDFEHFKKHAHELFYDAFVKLQEVFLQNFPFEQGLLEKSKLKLILAGHSLGALLSLKALMLPQFSEYQKLSIAVGLGIAPKNVVHLFDTPFYKSTLKIREQLVSAALKPDNVFPWIKEEKMSLMVRESTIHLITGTDDLVVGIDGMEKFAEVMIAKGNNVTMERPSKLPHHEPQLAASYVKKYLKKINWV